jgi:hypothetical protein
MSVTAGQTAVVACYDGNVTSPTVTISDTIGGTFTQVTGGPFVASGTNGVITYWVEPITTTNASNVYACATTNTGGSVWAIVALYTGLTAVWDQPSNFSTIGVNNSAVTALTSGTTSTGAHANDLAFGCFGLPGVAGVTFTAGSGWTIETGTNGGMNAASGHIVCEDQILSSTAGVTATMTASGSSSGPMVVATIKGN